MRIPKLLQWPLAALALAGAASMTANAVKRDVDLTLNFNDTPLSEVEWAICDKFPDKNAQKGAMESIDRLLAHIAGQYRDASVTAISWSFYLDEERGNSLLPKDFDHSQQARVNVHHNDGTDEIVYVDIAEVPKEVIDNSLQSQSK